MIYFDDFIFTFESTSTIFPNQAICENIELVRFTFLKVTTTIILSFPTQQRTKQQEEKMDTNKIQTAAWSICPYDAVKSADMRSVSSAI